MADERGTFGIVGMAWETAKIYNGSNTISKFDAVIESESLRTLGEFVRDPRNMVETGGLDFDEKSDDMLAKYNIVKITPTRNLSESENVSEMYLITDEKGQDIGVYYPAAEKGEVGKFILADKYKGQNEKVLSKFAGQKDLIEAEIDREYKVDNIKDLAGKLSRGEALAISEADAKGTIREDYEKKGMTFEEADDGHVLTEEEQQEKSEEQEVLDSMPPELREQAIQFAREHDLKIKDILIIQNPESLLKNLGENNKLGITKDGGPIIMLKTNHGGADSLNDDVYVAQSGKSFLHDEQEDEKLETITEVHKGQDNIDDLTPEDYKQLSEEDAEKMLETNNTKALAANVIIQEAKAKIEEEKAKIATLEEEKKALLQEYQEGTAEPEELTQKLKENSDAIAEHKGEIANAITTRDTRLDGLMSREPDDKSIDMPEIEDVEADIEESEPEPEMPEQEEEDEELTIYNTHNRNQHQGN